MENNVTEKNNVLTYCVWVGKEDGIASFHEVDGYEANIFSDHDEFIAYVTQLQEQRFRFM